MKLFENKVGDIVDFESRMQNVDPDNTTGTLFYRENRDDFFFKVDVAFAWFSSNSGVLRHETFKKLVREAHEKKRLDDESAEKAKYEKLIADVTRKVSEQCETKIEDVLRKNKII